MLFSLDFDLCPGAILGGLAAFVCASLLPVDNAWAQDAPRAYVFEHEDQWNGSKGDATAMLEQAGFIVKPLPLDESPWELKGLIFIGSFATEHPQYAAYMREYADDLYNFVDKGNVLLQMTQADQVEAEPPFLPTTHGARRADVDAEVLTIRVPGNPLLEGIPAKDGKLLYTGVRASWETFEEQGGFEVMIDLDDAVRRPVMMEGAYGQGRIILCSMSFDKPVAEKGHGVDESLRLAFAKKFYANLKQHTLNVMARKTKALGVTPSSLDSRKFVEGSWTIAVLPDTQVYSLRFPGMFDVQTSWVRRNVEQRQIKYVLHLGDIVNNNTHMEWKRARASMSMLDGVVPYAIVPGNHDYGPSGDASTRDTLMNDYFSFKLCTSWDTFGGAMEVGKLDNTFHLFEAGGQKWIIVALEWGPRDSTIQWANDVMKKYPDRTGILITHAYMNNNDRRYDDTDKDHPQHYNPHHYRTPGGVNDGQELWDKLVKKHNFALVMNGHVLGDGTGYMKSMTDRGNVCHQMLSNFQMRKFGGEGYMRLLEFQPDGRTIRVRSYSPLYDNYLLEEDQHFTIEIGGEKSALPD